MQSKSKYGEALNVVTRDIGVPDTLISDNAREHTGPNTELQECICRFCIDGSTTEPYSPWNNRTKNMIKTLKEKAK